MRARSTNTWTRLAVALAAPVACTVALAACGSSGEDPQALLSDTFSSHNSIESGRIDLSLVVSASGSGAPAKPLSVRLSGPFQSQGPPSGAQTAKLPRFALSLDVSAGGHTLTAGATATGSALYVQLAGTWFSTPSSTYTAIEEGFAQASRQASQSKVQSTFSSLGIDPAKWLSSPSDAGTSTVAGVRTVHLTADVNIPAFLADVSKLSQAGSRLGLGTGLAGAPSISPSAIDELAKSFRSAHVDVYTGADDHTLRRLEVGATVVGTAQTQALLGGLTGAHVRLVLEISDLNKTQSISAPSNPQPASQLLPALQQLVGGLTGGLAGGGSTLEPLVKG